MQLHDQLASRADRHPHNLRALDWTRQGFGFDWARRFDEAARVTLTETPSEAVALQGHPDFARAAPTPDHLIPLLYVAGLAAAAGRGAKVLVDGYEMGALSMTSYTVQADCPEAAPAEGDATPRPDLPAIPPEDTNL